MFLFAIDTYQRLNGLMPVRGLGSLLLALANNPMTARFRRKSTLYTRICRSRLMPILKTKNFRVVAQPRASFLDPSGILACLYAICVASLAPRFT